jgi:hypothetical protein
LNIAVTVRTGRNALQFIGAGTSDGYGLIIDGIQLVRLGITANIVLNGDFSNPNVQGSWGLFNGISGWNGVGIEVGYASNYGIGTNQQCELDGSVNYEISQYFTFDNLYNQISNENIATCNSPQSAAALKYTLEFDWAIRTLGAANTDTSKANILWNDVVIASLGCNGNQGINHASLTVSLNAGDNFLQFDGTSSSDTYGVTIDNVRLTSAYNCTNLIVNGDFSSPCVGSGWNYYNGGIAGWSAAKAEVGGGNNYNSKWASGQVIELDSDSNQRYTQLINISQSLYAQLV